ncbi:PPE family protein [Mycobacterium sp. pUA109]|uniref:PPE family protein n=1 Tax=Mycobacterium sp. pUA109 TaxID=3238982 RepID=UPI00351AFB88
MSFLAFPPEINSGLMYAGPGSASLMAAAAAWDALAADLSSSAVSYGSVVSGLTGGPWTGTSSTAMTSAVAPYVAWLQNTSDQAAQIGAQVKAQAGLYETAHAGTIPPAVIEANRALLAALVATNFFGQNTPAIMAAEAMYGEFWAQDGAVMDTYMASSQSNVSTLEKPTPAPAAAKATGVDQAAAAKAVVENTAQNATAQVTPDPLSGILDPGSLETAINWVNTELNQIPIVGSFLGTQLTNPASLANYGSIPARFAMYPISMLMQLARMGQSGATSLTGMGAPESLMTAIGQFVDGKLQGAVGTLAGHFTSATQAISAKLGQAASMGALKVPQAWSAAAGGTMVRAAPVLPNTAISAPAMSSSAFPGGPLGQALMGALSGKGLSSVAAKVPKVIPRSPVGG